MTETPDISVLVSTWNRGHLLRDALQSLIAQETSDRFTYEIVVVDNQSDDDTPAVIDELRVANPALIRTVREERRGVVHARNRAVAEARGEWLAFFDDDQIADPRWLSQLRRTADEKQCQCVGGAVRIRLPEGVERNLGPFCRKVLCETVGQDSVAPYTRLFKPGTGNMMIHRDLFRRYGPFDLRFNDRGEDTILFLALHNDGQPAWFTPYAVVEHVIPHERLTDDAFLAITRRLARECPHFERLHYGRIFPLAWTARLLRAVGYCFPRFVVARCFQDHDTRIDRHCQFLLEWLRVLHGAPLLLPSRIATTFPPTLRPQVFEELGN